MPEPKNPPAPTLRAAAQVTVTWSDNHNYPHSASAHEVLLQAEVRNESANAAGVFSLLADQLAALSKEARARARDAMREKSPLSRAEEYERARGEAMDPTDNPTPEDMG